MSTVTQYTTRQIRNFNERIPKAPTDRGCLEWKGYTEAGGYGCVNFDGKRLLAHRVAWEIANGPIPDGLLVCHHCDNRRCVNVAHLFLGTTADNAHDRDRKGRRNSVQPPRVPPVRRTATERFYLRVSETPTERGCLEWIAGVNPNGYGYLGIGRRVVLAHRFAWELSNGPIPDGLVVCHHCDNRLCVNVDHLFLGTRADNNRDKANKGRSPDKKGEKGSKAKLSNDQVLEIRSGKFSSWRVCDIAEHFGISPTNTSSILNCKTWKHLDSSEDAPSQNRQARGERQGNSKLTDAQILEIRSGKFAGWTDTAIAKHFGISLSSVNRILRRKSWKHLGGSGDIPIRRARLTEAEVLEIRSNKWAGKSHAEIGAHFEVSRGLIGLILNRKAWKHI